MGIANIIKKAFHCVANFNVVTEKKKGAIFEDILGDHVVSMNNLWKRGYFVEAASGVEFFGVDLEKEDCIIVKNIGVESVKCMLFGQLL